MLQFGNSWAEFLEIEMFDQGLRDRCDAGTWSRKINAAVLEKARVFDFEQYLDLSQGKIRYRQRIRSVSIGREQGVNRVLPCRIDDPSEVDNSAEYPPESE